MKSPLCWGASSSLPTITFPYKLPLRYANAPKTLVTCLRYHVIITTTNSVSRLSKTSGGNGGRLAGGGMLTARRSVEGVN
jgi:hypothetical protein